MFQYIVGWRSSFSNIPHVHFLFLAPYSFLLNPIELLWSAFKSHIKRKMQENMNNILNVVAENGLFMTEQRMRMLEEFACEAIGQITPNMLLSFSNRVEKYYPAAARQEDLEEIIQQVAERYMYKFLIYKFPMYKLPMHNFPMCISTPHTGRLTREASQGP